MNTHAPRRLRSETIVSDEFYVFRQADRQLSEIIDGMGRPGYVLVARQMGKTNLLLNMKRRVEQRGDMVIYIDLSQKFESARACFRHIIDLAIESHFEIFEAAADQIAEDRISRNIDASLEYTRHLRILIRAAKADRFIIILDEIDSLVHAAYSDTVLAHVRSTYFVRTNYAEFRHLTYVLSGVVEPSDLIKDKNISPFNIGEKIYLDDFSKDEFRTFVNKSQLDFSEKVFDRVFFWSQGNPRITWDVLADLENLALSGASLTTDIVDEAIRRLYLTSFNLPPIDHIRTLVENDASLRISLMAIRYNKGDTLDERAKGKLYLAGIIGDPGRDPIIRNPVIDEALSESWLTRLEAINSDPVALGIEHFSGRRYQQSKESFDKAKSNGVTFAPTQAVIHGLSLFNLGLYDESVDVLIPIIEKVRGETRTRAEYHLGSAYMLTSQPDKALPILNRASEEGTGIYRFPSQIMRAAANYQAGADADETLRLSSKQTIVAAAASESVGEELGDATVVPSLLYSVGYSALGAGYADDASEYLDSALSLAPPGLLPAIYITKYAIENDYFAKKELALLASNSIIEHQLHPVDAEAGAAAYTERGLLAVLLALSEVDLIGQLNDLAAFVISNDKIDHSPIYYISLLLTKFSDAARLKNDLVIGLLNIFNDSHLSDSEKIVVERAYASFAPDGHKTRYIKKFVGLLVKTGEPVTDDDLSTIVLALQEPMSVKDFGSVLEITTAVGKLDIATPNIWSTMAIYYKMTVERNLELYDQAKSTASQLLSVATLFHSSATSEFTPFADTMISQANRLLDESMPPLFDNRKKFGRNEKVRVLDKRNGRVFIVKFKNIETRMNSGDYQILPPNS